MRQRVRLGSPDLLLQAKQFPQRLQQGMAAVRFLGLLAQGADEVFAGYDIMKEAKIRRFCADQPASQRRPLLLSCPQN